MQLEITGSEQHRIPQQISSYQFRLVGDMTIKQFAQVAAGSLIALIIYSSNLPGFIRWPLTIISVLAGIAFAFFPFQDRPLSKWLFLFIKAIYSPTIYSWKKLEQKIDFFQPEPSSQVEDLKIATPTTQTAPSQQEPTIQTQIITPQPAIDQGLEEKPGKATAYFQPIGPSQIEPEPELIQKPSEPKRKGVKVVETAPLAIDKSFKRDYLESKPFTTTSVGSYITPQAGQKAQGAQVAQFSQEAAPPAIPQVPNIIVGQVMDSAGKIIEAAILEIKDSEGRSVRALKSNQLGHFMIVTPLLEGKYEIITEKEGFVFDPLSFEARGKIIPPIAIKAKAHGETIN